MKISDNFTITSGMHVFETPEDLIINSQVYDKFSMEPKPYNFFNIQTLANKNLLLHEVNILEYNWVNPSKDYKYKYYIQDNQDSSIFYCVLEIGKTDPNQYFHKIQKVNNNYKLIKSVSPDSDYKNSYQITTKLHYKMIGQSKDYILIVQETISASISKRQVGFSYGGWYLGPAEEIPRSPVSYIIIKKNDLSTKVININNTSHDNGIYLIKEKENGIYTLENIDGSIYVCFVDLINSTRSVLYSNTSYGSANTVGIANVIEFQDYYYTLVGTHVSGGGRKFLKFQIDETLRKVNNAAIETIDNNLFPMFTKNERDDYYGDSWIRYSLSNVNDQYIQITTHNNQNKQNGKAYIQGYTTYGHSYAVWYAYFLAVDYTLANNGRHRHFLCKKNDSQWNIVNIITPANTQQFIYGVLYLNQYTPILHLSTGVEIYKLNLETEKYIKVFDLSGTFQTIGLDENNNFYTFDINNNCKMYNKATCSTIHGDFEQETYNYDGEDILTYVTISSKNFIGETISSKINVELSGNCHFLNSKQKAILNTLADREYQVPVIINGPGIVYCNINEVE